MFSTLLLATALLAALPHADAREDEPSPLRTTMTPRVTRIELDVRLEPQTGLMRQEATVRVEGSGVAELVFRLDEGLVVEKLSAGEGFAEQRRAGELMHVDLDAPLAGERTLRFLVTGRPKRAGKALVAPERAVLGPWDAWYPVFGATWAETSVTVRVPPGWTAVAPGALQAKTETGVFTWRTGKPVRTLAVAAAPGLELSEGSVLGTRLRLAAPAKGPALALVSERLRDGLAWLSGALAPYPFDGFNVAAIPGFSGRVRAGGLVIVPADEPLANASDGADLLAGQWFGERLAGDGPWIEAWSAWQATVFARDRALPPPAQIEQLRRGYFALLSGDTPLLAATSATPDEVLRGKGSAVPDMIRLAAGDRPFFAALRELFARPVGPPITLAELRAAIEKHAQRSLARAFADWFEGRGAPQIVATLRTFPAAGGGFRVDLELVQKRGTYALPVEVVLVGPGQEHRETVEIDETTTTLVYDLPFEPVRVVLDPNGKLFRRP
jgi:hypothetical protein